MLGIEGTMGVALFDPSPTYHPMQSAYTKIKGDKDGIDLLHVRLRHESNATPGLLAVH